MVKTLEKIRRVAFWSLDALKGGKIRRHYRQIAKYQDNPTSDKGKRDAEENLSKILTHAVKTTPFYMDVPVKSISLENFPIIDKQTVREQFELFRSNEYSEKYSHQVLTSGSTGKPFKILHDKNKRDRNTADTLFFAKRGGYNLGARLYYLRLWDKQYKKNKFLSQLQNMGTYSVDDLTDENIKRLLDELENNGSNNNLLVYTSALDSICKYLDKNPRRNLNGKVSSIIAVAEALGSDVKEKAEHYFGIETISRYSNSENGILAQQRLGSKGSFEINWASYFVEILDLNEDKPVKNGEPGRIVITDLFNYSMPMIRYDTGDVGTLKEDATYGSLVFAKVEGRKMDMFTNTRGEFVSSHIIHHILQFKGIDQFQFVEEHDGVYVIKLKVSADYDRNDETRLRNQYMEYFGDDAKIKIEYVKEIPLLPSGKRKLVINKAIQKQKNLSNLRAEQQNKDADLVH